MNAYLRFDNLQLWHVLGWTMVHFLWLGALVAFVALACRIFLRRASPNARYVVAAASLALLAVLPVVIAAWLVQHPRMNTRIESGIAAHDSAVGLTRADIANDVAIERYNSNVALQSQSSPAARGFAAGLPANRVQFDGFEWRVPQITLIVSRLESCIVYLPWIWFIGAPVTLSLLATGIVGTQRLRRLSQPIAEGPVAEIGAQLAKSLQIGRRVTIGICERIAAPVVMGILRPMILLPPAAISGWSPDEIEMVLLHELAHVRRWDNLVNLLQRLLESLLFFHPAVWLISRWVRRERESCCDAVVVARTSRPHAYAELLVALAAQMPRSVLFHPAASSAMAAGPLRNRIRRILQLEEDPMLISGKSFVLVLAGLLVAGILGGLYLPAIGQADESATETAVDTEASDEPADAVDSADELSSAELRINSPSGEVVINAEDDHVNVHSELSEEISVSESRSGSASEAKSPERRILGTFSNNFHEPHELLRAVDQARAKNLNVDIIADGDKWNLVVVPERTEADWPAILGDPPRKERVIADKAWELLGLKLIPASQLESIDFNTRRLAGPIKIVGGNMPKGMPLPAFLRRVGDRPLESFEDLHAWLIDREGKRPVPVKAYAFADGHEYLFDVQPADERKPIEAVPPPSPQTARKFPSFEEQKLADLAWKMLQLELESIDDKELKRVKAKGFDGGLMVSGTAHPTTRQANYFDIQRGDILVGLHVWPTSSLHLVADILNRDDLASLNPLKFYVVRPEPTHTTNSMVITGRIQVRTTGVPPSAVPSAQSTPREAAEAATAQNNPLQKQRSTGITITGGSQETLDQFIRLAPSATSVDSIGVLKRIVEREKQKYDRMAQLALDKQVSATEVETQKADYEVSMERLRQAMRALEYHKLSVDLAKADYEAALEANKAAPRAVAESELRRLKLRVQLAEAKLQELAQ